MINLKQACKSIFLAVFFICTALTLAAADRYSVASGNWNSTSTWSASSGGASGASVPVAGDDVFIESSHTVTVTANASCSSLTFTADGSILTINSGVTLTISGTLTRNKINDNSSSSLTGDGTISCGSIAVGSSVNSPTGFFSFYSHIINSTVATINISGNLSVNSYSGGFLNFRNGIFNFEQGTINVSGTVRTQNSSGFNFSTFSMAEGAQSGVLVLSGSPALTASGTGTSNIVLNGSSSLVNYSRAGDQTVYATTYNNLTLSGSGAKTITGSTINGILSMEGSATAAGTTPAFGSAATLQYKGSAAQTTGIEFPSNFTASGGIKIDNTSGVTLGSDKTIESNINLVSGALSTGSITLTFQNSDAPILRTAGTITTSTGTNIFFGTSGNTSGAAFSIPSGTFTSAPTINNLTINRINSLTLGNQMLSIAGILLCNGPLATNDNLTLLSDASGTALIDGSGTGQVTGNVIMQRYLPVGFGYKYFSSPFQSATVSEFGDDMDLTYWFPTFYEYDESRTSSGWVDYTTSTNVLQPMVGYAVNFGSVSAPNTVDVTGTVNNGSLSLTLYNNNNTYTQGLNLVGNPYPSAIDWDAASGWTKTNIDDAVYFFKASATDEYGGTYSSYISGVSSDGIVSNIIPSMQGFFVHVSDGTYPVTGTLGMNNNVRVNDQTQVFTKSLNLKGTEKSSAPLIRLASKYEDDDTSTDPMVIYLHHLASQSFDSEYDALKILNTDLNIPNLYVLLPDDKKLSISSISPVFSLPLRIPLGLKTNRNGNVSFFLLDRNEYFPASDIVLHDSITGTRQPLGDDSMYTVNLGAGEYHGRFFLEITGITTENTKIPVPDSLFTVYSSNGILKTNIYELAGDKGTVSVFNLTGQMVKSYIIRQPGYHEFIAPEFRGIYIITYSTGSRRSSRKIIIGN